MSHRILHVIPEDPQVEHVPKEVQQPSVEEHRGEEGNPDRQRDRWRKIDPAEELPRHQAVAEGEEIAREMGLDMSAKFIPCACQATTSNTSVSVVLFVSS